MMVNLKLNGEYMALAGASLGSKIFDDDSKFVPSGGQARTGQVPAQSSIFTFLKISD